MLVYIIPILICALSACSRELSLERRWAILIGVLFSLIYCWGYMTGSDWRAYEFWYDNLDFNRFYYGYTSEPGYYLYMMLMKKLHIPFWLFFSLTKTALFVIIYKSLFDMCRESGWLSLMYYLPCFGLYFFVDNPMRNCIAVGIFLISAKYIVEHRFWPFFFLILLAACFHLSALIIIPLYPLLNKDVKKMVYVVLYVVINALFWNRDLIINMVSGLASLLGIPYLNSKVITYFLMDSDYVQGEVFSLMLIWQTLLFFLLICYKERIVKALGDKGLFAFNCSMVYFLLVRFVTSIQVLMRLQLFFSVYVCVCIGLIILSFEWRSRVLYMSLLFAISIYLCVEKTTATGRYIPYSNVIEYALKGENPSFSARFYYNMKHSPYTTDIDYGK